MLQNSFRIYILLLLFMMVGCNRGGNILIVGSISGPEEVAEGTTVEYSVDAEGDSGITYKWVVNPVGFGTLDTPATTSTTFTAPEVESDFEIVIRVVVNSDNDGPVVRSLDVIVMDVAGPVDPPVNHPPTAAAYVTTSVVEQDIEIQFFDNSTDPDGNDDIVLWEWDFSYDPGDGLIVESTDKEPVMEFPEPGIFVVQLRVTDSTGLSDILDELIQITVLYEHPVVVNGFSLGGRYSDNSCGISLDPSGKLIVVGTIAGKVDLDPGENLYELEGDFTSAFIAKYDPDTYSILAATLTDGRWFQEPDRVKIDELTYDNDGTYYISGIYDYSDYDYWYTGPFIYRGTFIRSFQSTNWFNWELHKANTISWYDIFFRAKNYIYSPVACDSQGNIFYFETRDSASGGWFMHTEHTYSSKLWIGTSEGPGSVLIKFDETHFYDSVGESLSGVTILQHLSGIDSTIRHYTPDGILTWEVENITAPDDAYAIIRSDLAGISYILNINDNNVTKISPDGAINQELDWEANAEDIFVYDDGSFLVSGTFEETVDFDPGIGETILENPGSTSGYISFFDAEGNFQWVETWWCTSMLITKDITADNEGNIYVCGDFWSSIYYGPPPSPGFARSSNGNSDIYVLKLSRTPQKPWIESPA